MSDEQTGATRSVGQVADGLTIDLRDDAPSLLNGRGVAPHPVPFVDLGLSHRQAKAEIDAAVMGVIERGDFVLGAAVADFEARYAAYCGAGHGVGVDSGYSALEMILRGFDIGPGDEVITTANTFIATAAAVESVGARPRLVDVDPKTYNLDVDKLEAAITPATRAVIPVHLYGQPADMTGVRRVAGERGLKVIEDACQAHGARYLGDRTGSLGDAAAFSFYPSKNLGALGDGGMVVTDDPELADRVRMLRNLGSRRKYVHELKGFNHRLDTLHAAVLSVKLDLLDAANASRARVARIYDEMLSGLPVSTPWVNPDGDHVYHLYVIETDHREPLQAYLGEHDISVGIHYPVPIHLQPAYADLGYGPGSFPVTEAAAGRILSLPMYPHMPLESIVHVADTVRAYFQDR